MLDKLDLLEVRGHARGGQGMVTAFEILAKSYSRLEGHYVQAFPFFGVERTGAPVLGFLRISKNQILNRSNIYQPHLIVVFDESLLGQVPVFDGLQQNGSILLNTEKDPSAFQGKAKYIYTVHATDISIQKGLGTKSLPIVNSAMIGAIIKVLDGDLDVAIETVKQNVPAKPEENAEATEMAYHNVFSFSGDMEEQPATEAPKQDPLIDSTVPLWDKPMNVNKTGNWRALRPAYITKPAPCSANCPAGTDVRLFVKQATDEDFDSALNTIHKHNPFPSICGRVCPHFCQQNCNRKEFDECLNIGSIERFLGDNGFGKTYQASEIQHKEKIAVIGAGPAGLTAALRLRQKGYETVVYEALPWAGGMMRTGIPEFRLPQNILDKEIEAIEAQGVEIRLNQKVSVSDIEKDYEAVIVAVGSHIGSKMKVPNEELCEEGIDFLREFKLNNVTHINKGDKVAVIGGGNTAIDVARTVVRLGADATIYYRRTRKEMPAIPHEIDEAEAESVKIEYLTAPVGIEKNGNTISGINMVQMELGEPDDSGRRRPIPIKDSEKIIEVDKVITAIGQWYDTHVFDDNELETKQGKINFSSSTKVFCSGDMAWGGTVVEAIGSGNQVAEEVQCVLQGTQFSSNGNEIPSDVVTWKDINPNYYIHSPSQHNPQLDVTNLTDDFREVVQGLTSKQVAEEAARCLHCGECYSCGNCYNYCPDAAIYVDEDNRLRIDYDFCKGCGICFSECPCSSIQLTKEGEVSHG